MTGMSASETQPRPATLFRRLAALFYDSLLLLAVWFIATALLLPFTSGEAIRPHNPLLSSYLLFISFFFYGWFWIHGGQTLGMSACSQVTGPSRKLPSRSFQARMPSVCPPWIQNQP